MSSPPLKSPRATIRLVDWPAPAPLSVCGLNCALRLIATVELGSLSGRRAISSSKAARTSSLNDRLCLGWLQMEGIAPTLKDPEAPPWPSRNEYADALGCLPVFLA